MKYIAKVGFSGLVSMRKGEIKEITVKYIAKDLIKAGYIEPANKQTEVETEEEAKAETEEEAEAETEKTS